MVGNHTWTHPNIAATPLAQTDLEINTTQRLFEVLTGRSMRLFRPPYFGDAEPSTPGEVEPLLVAQRLGYLIAGLRIDPAIGQKPTPRADHPDGPWRAWPTPGPPPARWCCCTTPAATAAGPSRPCRG